MCEQAQQASYTTKPEAFLSTPMNSSGDAFQDSSAHMTSLRILNLKKAKTVDDIFSDIVKDNQLEELKDKIVQILHRVYQFRNNREEVIIMADPEQILEKFYTIIDRICSCGEENERQALKHFMQQFELSDIYKLLHMCVDGKEINRNLVDGLKWIICEYRNQ